MAWINVRDLTLQQVESVERLSGLPDFEAFMQILLSSRAELLESLVHETRDSEIHRLQGGAQLAGAIRELVDSSSEVVRAKRSQIRGS